MLSEQLSIPEALEKQLVEAGLLKYIVEYFLSEENLQLESAIDVVLKYHPESVRSLIDQDLRTFVFLMKIFEESLLINQNL